MHYKNRLVKSEFLKFVKLQHKFLVNVRSKTRKVVNDALWFSPASSQFWSRLSANVVNFRFPGTVSRLIHENAGRSRYIGDVLLDITGRQVVRATAAFRHPAAAS